MQGIAGKWSLAAEGSGVLANQGQDLSPWVLILTVKLDSSSR